MTPSEFTKLEAAVLETGVTKSLLVLEAIQAGLSSHNLKVTQERRSRTTHAWAPVEVERELRGLAAKLNVTQQHLLRHLLFDYLSTAPWRLTPRKRERQRETKGGDGHTA